MVKKVQTWNKKNNDYDREQLDLKIIEFKPIVLEMYLVTLIFMDYLTPNDQIFSSIMASYMYNVHSIK